MKNLRANCFALIFMSLTLLLALAACGPSPDSPTTEPVQQSTATQPAPDAESNNDGQEDITGETEEGYPPPAPTTAVAEGPYPPPTREIPTAMSSYPDPEATREDGVLFAFERPISAGDTTLSGVGPAGLEVSIINVTFMGEEIATTTIGDDGRFEVTVPALEPGVRIGLTADIEGTDLAERLIPGEGEIGMPQVGYFFDSVVIIAEPADS